MQLYKRNNKYYKKKRVDGYKGYVLWQPVKKFLGLFWISFGEAFWLDDIDFEKV